MAIVLNEESQGKPRGSRIIAGSIIVALIVAGAYYLFFAPVPFIETVVPEKLDPISRISKIQVDPAKIINSPIYQSLKEQVPQVKIEGAGRVNPFQPF